MGDAQIQEAGATTQQVVGFSAYLHGTGYSVEQFQRELDQAVAHIRAHSGQR